MKLSKARLIVAYIMARELAQEFSALDPNHRRHRGLDAACRRVGLHSGHLHEADRVVKAAGDPGLYKEATQ